MNWPCPAGFLDQFLLFQLQLLRSQSLRHVKKGLGDAQHRTHVDVHRLDASVMLMLVVPAGVDASST